MGPFLVLLSAAAFGVMAVLAKFAYAAGVSPESLLLVRFTLAAVLLWLLVRARSARVGRGPAVLVALLGLGAVGYAAQASFYFEALQFMDASVLTIVYYVYPALVTVAAAALGREVLTSGRVVALIAATAGVGLVVLGNGIGAVNGLGVALGLATALSYTVYVLVSDRVSAHLDPLPLAALVFTGAALTLGARAALDGGPDLGFAPVGWFWLVCIAVVSTVLAMVAFFAGMARTGPSTASILSMAEPIVTAALAAVVLHEAPTPVQVVGGAVVLVAVTAIQLRPRRTPAPVTAPPSNPEGARL